MRYIIRWFKSVRKTVILTIATIVFVIKVIRYTTLFDLHKIDVDEYKLYGSKAAYNYCRKCVRYGLTSTDVAASSYNVFLSSFSCCKNMNGNS